MKQPDNNRPGAREDLFGLSIRGQKEELGLTVGDYGPIRITWLGILQAILQGHVVAVIGKVAAARKLLTLVFYGLRDGHIRCLARPV